MTGSAIYVPNLGPNYPSFNYELTVTNTCGSVTVSGGGNLTNCGGPAIIGTTSSSLKAKVWKMQLSPNPVNNELTINLSEYDDYLMHTMGEMHVVNMMGQTVYQAKQVLDNNMRLNTQNLNNGFYILEIKGEGFSTRQRFNVSR